LAGSSRDELHALRQEIPDAPLAAEGSKLVFAVVRVTGSPKKILTEHATLREALCACTILTTTSHEAEHSTSFSRL
jgi:hypothetical protein